MHLTLSTTNQFLDTPVINFLNRKRQILFPGLFLQEEHFCIYHFFYSPQFEKKHTLLLVFGLPVPNFWNRKVYKFPSVSLQGEHFFISHFSTMCHLGETRRCILFWTPMSLIVEIGNADNFPRSVSPWGTLFHLTFFYTTRRFGKKWWNRWTEVWLH